MAVNIIDHTIYIGQTTATLKYRRSKHLHRSNSQSHKNKTYFHNALRKYGETAFEWDVLEDNIPIENLSDTEVFWIAYFKYIGAKLYNLTCGGESLLGYRHCDEAKQKISKANTGKKRFVETRSRLSQALLGKMVSTNTKDKISLSRSNGRIVSFIDAESNVYLNITNVSEFARQHNVSARGLNSVAAKQQKLHRGFRLYISELT